MESVSDGCHKFALHVPCEAENYSGIETYGECSIVAHSRNVARHYGYINQILAGKRVTHCFHRSAGADC
jgi:hypothetical protein